MVAKGIVVALGRVGHYKGTVVAMGKAGHLLVATG